jgi:uncharacterized protein YjbJ (UPF0337 family)
MKRLLPLIILLLTYTAAEAQLFKKKERSVEPQYNVGTVPVANGKVTFEESIQAEGLTAAQIEERVNNWITTRFVEPTIISVKKFDSDQPATTVIKGEEYIVFKDKFFVLSRARMYYFLTLTAEDGCCNFHLSRITYWYDDEDDKGGIKMIAEDWITDDNAFNKKGKMKRFEGKFRRKTIDLKEQLINELTQALNQ